MSLITSLQSRSHCWRVPLWLGVALALVLGGCNHKSDSTTASEDSANLPPSVEIASSHVLLFSRPLLLSGVVTDDGKPQGTLSVVWSTVDGPGAVSFDPSDSVSTSVTFERPGNYTLRLKANDGLLASSKFLQVQVILPHADYFIDPSGSDLNDGRTIDSPFRTIRHAASVVKPGDTILLRGGVYNEYNVIDTWITSGEPGSPITFMSYPGEVAIIDGSDRRWSVDQTFPAAPELFRLVGIDWYVFDGLVFRNSAGRGLALEGSHHVVRNVVSHSNHSDGVFVKGNYNLIENSISFDNYSRSNGGDSADGFKIDSGRANVIRASEAYSNSDDGFDIWASTQTLLEKNVSHHNGRGPTGNGQGFKLSRYGSDADSVIRFNVAFSNRSNNFTDNGGGALTVYNNTSWDAGEFGFVFRGRDRELQSHLANNISFEDRRGVLLDIQFEGGVLPSSTTNNWDLGIMDPGFLSTTYGEPNFLRLSAESSLIGVGTSMGFSLEKVKPDLGAYPYEGAGESVARDGDR